MAEQPGPAAGNNAERIEASAFQPMGAPETRKTLAINPWRLALAGGGLLFVLVLFFLLSARSVEIVVVAESKADINLGGLHLPFGQRYLIRPGDYALSVTAAGYQPYEDRLQVTRDANQRLDIALTPRPGVVTVTGAPQGARVYVDSEFAGATPFEAMPVAAGKHTLRIEAERYQPLLLEVAITGRTVSQTIAVTLQPAWADVVVASVPAGAQVLVDGEAAGVTPAALEILEGERQLILRSAGFADLERQLEIVAGEALDLGTLELQPALGILELASDPSGANVTVDGEFRGQTPLTLELTPDRQHQLVLSRPGYRRLAEPIQLAAGEQAQRSLRLTAQLGEVVFELAPADAELRLNGKLVGRGSQELSLPAFEHRVDVTLPGYAPVRKRVTPRPGLKQLVAVTLKTEEAARMARLLPEVTSALGQTLRLFSPANASRSEFTMGASRRQPGRRANEVLHPVRLERPFYLQTTEVTNAQFRQFQTSHNSGQVQGNSLNREHQPAVQVSWQQAAAFCNWLSAREGLPPFYTEKQGIITGFRPDSTGYRLPTEAEWAWASRVSGEALLTYSWGETFPPPDNTENFADSASAYVTGRILSGYADGQVVSAPVASYAPNHNKLYDMGGNVAEWVHDVYVIPPANDVVQTDPLGGQGGDNYTIRGASWALGKLAELRLTYRDYGQAGRDDVGFRIARYAE